MYKVVLADDEEFVRYFLKSVIESIDFEVVAEVDDGERLPDVMFQTEPDILLLDINMPNLTGIEFLKEFAHEFQNTCIIILTSSASSVVEEEASIAGSRCFLRKDLPIEELIFQITNTWSAFIKERASTLSKVET